MDKIDSFEKLNVWLDAQDLAVNVYRLSESFPKSEQFGLTNQLRRASTSISANNAEGFGRQSQKEKVQFYSIAYGSLLEVKNFIYLAQKLGFCSENDSQQLIESITSLQKMINALIKSVRGNA